jgi:8-oxo-dGTP pyrophosphatase MutT (NUDIX family)
MNEWVVAVAAIIVRGEEVLAMRRSVHKDAGPGLWETLSGRVEAGEQPLDAVIRETREECGLDVTFDAFPLEAYVAERRGLPMLVIVYRARYVGGEVTITDEHDEYRWMTPAEFARTTTLTRLAQSVDLATGKTSSLS